MGRLFAKLFFGSAVRRPGRFLVAALSIASATAIVALTFNLSTQVRAHLERELAEYGANAYVVPRAGTERVGAGGLAMGSAGGGGGIGAATRARLETVLAPPIATRPVALVDALCGDEHVLLCGTVGTTLGRFRPWWTPHAGGGDVAAALRAEAAGRLAVATSPAQAERLGWAVGQAQVLWVGKVPHGAVLVATWDGMGEEERLLVADLARVRALAGDPDRLGYLEVRTPASGDVPALRARLELAAPDVVLVSIDQVTQAEAGTLARVEGLLAVVALVVLVTAGIAVVSALTISVMERQAEIGLLKVLGAKARAILGLFLGEAALLAAAGGLPGTLAGLALSGLVSRRVFEASIGVDLRVIPLGLAVALVLALGAALIPVRRAIRVDPVVTLRGE